MSFGIFVACEGSGSAVVNCVSSSASEACPTCRHLTILHSYRITLTKFRDIHSILHYTPFQSYSFALSMYLVDILQPWCHSGQRT